MKLALISLLFAAAPAFAADAPKTEAPKAEAKKAPPAAPKDAYKTDDERIIYTYGYLVARNFTVFNLTPAELKVLVAGISDSVLGAQPKLDIRFYQPRVNDLVVKRVGATLAQEKEKGRAFTEKFVKENKPLAIPGGGWYLETKAGTGPMPSKTATIKAHYRGTLIDGTEFDSSYKRNEPYETSLISGVIPCWLNVFPMMKVGGKAKIVCPSEVAYNDEPKGNLIKAGATLLFDIELVEITKP